MRQPDIMSRQCTSTAQHGEKLGRERPPMTRIQRQMQFADVLELRLAKEHRHGFMVAEGVGVGVGLFEAAEQARGWVGRVGGWRQWLTRLGDPQTSALLVCAAEVQA